MSGSVSASGGIHVSVLDNQSSAASLIVSTSGTRILSKTSLLPVGATEGVRDGAVVVGEKVGVDEGNKVGARVGEEEGDSEGPRDGSVGDGSVVGSADGKRVGLGVAPGAGRAVGDRVPLEEGCGVPGRLEGDCVGIRDGAVVGTTTVVDGFKVGDDVGVDVGGDDSEGA